MMMMIKMRKMFQIQLLDGQKYFHKGIMFNGVLRIPIKNPEIYK